MSVSIETKQNIGTIQMVDINVKVIAVKLVPVECRYVVLNLFFWPLTP